MSGSVEQLAVDLHGSGDIKAFDLAAKVATVKISGSGDAKVNVSKHLKATTSGSGSVLYKGHPENVDRDKSGSGEIRAED